MLLEEEDRRDVFGDDDIMYDEESEEIDFEDNTSFSESSKLPIVGEGYSICPSLEELRSVSAD